MNNLSILNVGKGDLKISFDPKNPKELKRSAKIVKDLLSQGYAILVQVGLKDGDPIYRRAKGFDPETSEYLVMGDPVAPGIQTQIDAIPLKPEVPSKRGRKPGYRVPSTVPAVAVARTAGGYDPVLPSRITRGDLESVASRLPKV